MTPATWDAGLASTLALSFALVVNITWALERALVPQPAGPQARSRWANLVHILTLLGLWAVLLAVTAKPWLSAALVLSLALLIVLVNRDKYRELREPFLYCDFVYFWDVIRYPRLYLPYFGYGRAAGLLIAFLATLALWLWLEPGVLASAIERSLSLATAFITLALAYLLAQRHLAPELSLNPETDLRTLGLVAMLVTQKAAGGLWIKTKLQTQSKTVEPQVAPTATSPTAPPTDSPDVCAPAVLRARPTDRARLPDIVCIQAESFFDARRYYGAQMANNLGPTYTHWDAARAAAWRSGTLAVPAWGANTVRSEFSFLAGMPANTLGVHQFQPYALVKRTPPSLWGTTLPARLKALGFHCSFVHPYLAGFYDRNRVLPKLGFDEFVDIRGLGPPGGLGSFDVHKNYMPDPMLGQSVLQRLDAKREDQPLFMHVVTMQGHGPYEGHGQDPQSHFDGYLRTMQSTDQMLGDLLQALNQRADRQPTVVCLYGDHVPSLPAVYAAWGAPDGLTDYLIWRNWTGIGSSDHSAPVALHDLSDWVTKAAGLNEASHG